MTQPPGVFGIGVDVELISRWNDADIRLFTAAEVAHCRAQGNPAESFAGRWCAKEAVVKAFGSVAVVGVREVEIRAEEHGAPHVVLPARLSAAGWQAKVSIAHQAPLAIAIALVEKSSPDCTRER